MHKNLSGILAREIADMRQKIMSIYKRMNEINHRMIEAEQERDDPPSLAPSFTEIVGTTCSAPYVVYSPSSSSSGERIENFEYTTSEVERERKLLQLKMIHPGISTTSPDLDLHFK